MGGHHHTTRHSREYAQLVSYCSPKGPGLQSQRLFSRQQGDAGPKAVCLLEVEPLPGLWGLGSVTGMARLPRPHKHVLRPTWACGLLTMHCISLSSNDKWKTLLYLPASLPPPTDNKKTQITGGRVGRSKARKINSPLSFQKVLPSSQFLELPAVPLPDT